MLPHLPQEILIEILVRLPVKSLLRLRVLSISWNSLIKSKTFIDQHLTRSMRANDSSILLTHEDHTRNLWICNFYRDDGKCLTEDQVLEFPIKNKQYLRICACNGLLCLSDGSTNYLNIVLWNPSIRTCFEVPFPRFIDDFTDESQNYIVGLGFDSLTKQYKILRMIYVTSRKRMIIKKLEVEIFVLGMGNWRRLDAHILLKALCHIDSGQAYLHDAIHWIGYRPNNSKFIIVFDVHEEVFQEMEVPRIVRPSKCSLSLTVCEESLCLLADNPRAARQTGRIFIWVMKKYGVKESWTRMFSVNKSGQWGINWVLGFRKNGKLLVTDGDKGLVSYDSKKGSVELLRIHRKHDEIVVPNGNKELASYDLKNETVEELELPQYYEAIPHVECLVLLERIHGVEGTVSSRNSTILQGSTDESVSACETIALK